MSKPTIHLAESQNYCQVAAKMTKNGQYKEYMHGGPNNSFPLHNILIFKNVFLKLMQNILPMTFGVQ